MDKVWESRLDDKYDCYVEQDEANPYAGSLKIEMDGEILMRAGVVIQYGAPFGADMADIAMWQQAALDFIDGREGK